MKRTVRKSQKESAGRRVPVVDRAEELSGRVAVELPGSPAEVQKNFRRVRGCKLMPRLMIALDRGAVAESETAA